MTTKKSTTKPVEEFSELERQYQEIMPNPMPWEEWDQTDSFEKSGFILKSVPCRTIYR